MAAVRNHRRHTSPARPARTLWPGHRLVSPVPWDPDALRLTRVRQLSASSACLQWHGWTCGVLLVIHCILIHYLPARPLACTDPILCESGTYSNAIGQVTCDPCPDGHACPGGGSLQQCAPGTASASDGTSCEPCAVGSTSGAAAAVCTPCPQGSRCPDASLPPEPCPAGTYSLGGATACLACPGGTISPEGSAHCDLCPAGTYEPPHPACLGANRCRCRVLRGHPPCYCRCTLAFPPKAHCPHLQGPSALMPPQRPCPAWQVPTTLPAPTETARFALLAAIVCSPGFSRR